ncbi:hypothetical protein EUTSA_v10022376mg [Eutrema salsugineum]|uniref:SGNH hydrolase-type esterase domain-containing protein n=1 Tax=Eutrema salsugineum TaxID=72664 RepID=V4LXK3_EUTSA|nr:hypothetical protein EUTSA_v10022376mg [Eutrema salsugineum]
MANIDGFRSIILLFSTIILSINSINCERSLLTKQAALFVFGDSVFDVGNNNYINTFRAAQANVWPYGQTTFKFPTGRNSDGRLIPDFIAEYAWLPLIPPYLQPGNSVNQFTYGVNFASAGAGALIETYQPQNVIPLGSQLNNFKNVEKMFKEKLGDAETKRIISRAVYLIQIGPNDYFYPFSVNASHFQSNSKDKFVDYVIGNTTTVIEGIYKIGGRKFGIMNMGRLDCVPGMLTMDPTRIGSYLQRRLPGFKYSLFDSYTAGTEAMENPTKYGFKEVKKACCGSGPFRGSSTCGYRSGTSRDFELCENVNDYMFFDGSHTSEKANQQTAELMWDGPSDLVGPYNLKTLFQNI